MKFEGIGFSGYRSIGNDLVLLYPLKKINLIIGKNNVGKSNIINFLGNHLNQFHNNSKKIKSSNPKSGFSELDYPKSEESSFFRISYPMQMDELDKHIHRIFYTINKNKNYINEKMLARKILTSDYFSHDSHTLLFTYSGANYNNGFNLEVDYNKIKTVLEPGEWSQLWSQITQQSQGDIDRHWVPETLNKLQYIPESIPKVEIIPAIRKIGEAGSTSLDFSGDGIIDRLAKLQNPSIQDLESKDLFLKINSFVQNVLDSPDVSIEIPYERDMILVFMDNKTLPLESLGTGVHEVVILAAASTILKNTIICIEEPELHIHPLLQRKLLKYLYEETTNQYIFTTHSSHLLNTVDSEIFHVMNNNGKSLVTSINNNYQKSEICLDLGYRASDLLQTNSIIWVEGPSDRLYLLYWLNHYNPELIEGLHFSIMFFGGRLFSHLSGLDDEDISDLDDFISLRKLNRYSVILFDSDKKSSHNRLSNTKKRLKDEFNKGPGFAWITEGCEIENYLEVNKIHESIQEVHKNVNKVINRDKWSNLLKYKVLKDKEIRTANKVKTAKHYINKYEPNLNQYDLKKQIMKLNDFILSVNNEEI